LTKDCNKETSDSLLSKNNHHKSKGGSASSMTYNSPWTMNSKKKSTYEKSPIIGKNVINK